MDDLLKSLRELNHPTDVGECAADEIERLRGEVDRYKRIFQQQQRELEMEAEDCKAAEARAAALRGELDKELEDHEVTIQMAFVDAGANPPVAWKDVAAAMREALEECRNMLPDAATTEVADMLIHDFINPALASVAAWRGDNEPPTA